MLSHALDVSFATSIFLPSHREEIQGRRVATDVGSDAPCLELLRPVADAVADALNDIDGVAMLNRLRQRDDRSTAVPTLHAVDIDLDPRVRNELDQDDRRVAGLDWFYDRRGK